MAGAGALVVTRRRLPDPFDLIALVLGILFSLRQMDITQRQKASYPEVAEADFTRWQSLARGAYRLGGTACFGKIGFDIVFAFLLRRGLRPPYAVQLTLGIGATLACAVLVGIAVWRSRRSHELARELGIERPARTPSQS
jgi:hypothetical protein